MKIRILILLEEQKLSKSKKTKKEGELPLIDYDSIEMTVWFNIKEFTLTLFQTEKDSDLKLIELKTQNLNMNYQKQPKKMIANLNLQSLDIHDYLFTFTNPNLKKLMTSVPFIESSSENANLIEVHIVSLEQDHPKFNETMTNTDAIVKFGYLYVNFKPEIIEALMKFFLPVQSSQKPKESSHEPLEKKKTMELKTKKEETYTEDLKSILLNANIELREVGLRLIHPKSHICMARLALKNTNLKLKQQHYFTEFEGIIGNIQLFDTTNYPHTIDSNIEYSKIQEYEILGVSESDQNLLEVKFSQYDPQHPEADNNSNTYTFVDVKVSSIQVNYIQQPILRLINYIQTQVLPSLTVPEGQNLKENDTQITNQVNKEEAEKLIKKPSFMDLKVYVKSPIVLLKPLPDSTQFWEIKLGDVSVKNSVNKDLERVKNLQMILDFVYCQKFEVKLQNMGIFRVHQGDRARLTREVDFTLTVDMPMFMPEYKAVYQNEDVQESEKSKFEIDERMIIKGDMTPFIVILEHQDFLLLMKILNYNITYDDGKEKLFLSHTISSPNQNLGQEKQETEDSTQQAASPLTVTLTFEDFTLLALDKEGLPFSSINLQILQVNLSQDQNNAMCGSIRACELNGSYFEKTESSLIEKKMLGQLDRVSEHYISGKKKERVVDEIVTSSINYAKDLSAQLNSKKSEDQKNVQIYINLDFQPNGKKTVRIDIHQLNVFLVPDIYMAIVSFLEMDENVTVPQTNETHPLLTEEDTQENQNPIKEGSLRVEVDLRNILITVPASKPSISSSPYVLALRGDILCGFDAYATPNLDKALTDIKDKTFKRAIDQCTEENQVMLFKATLSQVELFICEYEELLAAKNFVDVRKRNIILPFTLSFTRKGHFVPNKSQTGLIPVAKNDIMMELLVIRMSYQDALLFNNTIQYQIEQLNKYSEDIKAETIQEESQLSNEMLITGDNTGISHQSLPTTMDLEDLKEDKDISSEARELAEYEKDNWGPNFEEITVGSPGIQLVLINDMEGTFVPVIELNAQDVMVTVIMVKKKTILSSRIVLSCSFFNLLPSKWEPVIERFCLDVGLVMQKNPQLSVIISTEETLDNLNINISEELVATLYSTMLTWKKDYERKIIKEDKTKLPRVAISKFDIETKNEIQIEDELIDFVSPYTIINQTGYPIEIETDTNTADSESQEHKKSGFIRSRSKKLEGLLNRVYKIQSGGKAQYLIESNIEDLFKLSQRDSLEGMNHIQVRIIHPDLDVNPLMGVSIDKALVTRYKLEATTRDGKVVPEEQFKLFSEVKLENNTKVITLSSPYKITNKTQTAYHIVLEGDSKSEQILLEPGEIKPIPFDMIDGNISLQTKETTTPSSKRPLRDFIDKEVSVVELKTDDTFLLVESVKKDTDYYEISLQPIFLIKNCCGLDVQYRITADVEEDPSVRKLSPQETLYENKISMKQQVYLQLRTQGFFWSEKVPIYGGSSKTKVENEIKVQDAFGNSLSVFLFYPEEESGTRKFLLYTKACIVNETSYDLKYSVFQDNQKVQLPGQIPTDADLNFNNKLALTNETMKLLIANKNNKEHSDLINVASVGNTFAELKQDEEEDNSMIELGLDLSLVQCDKEYKLMTKVITINPRYILVNNTDFDLEIRRYGGLKDPLLLRKGSREPFQWSDWHKSVTEKSISMRLQDPEQNDIWKWSNGLDITQTGTSNFIVQSNDKSQKKFLKTTVSTDNSMIFVIIEDEKPEKTAFKIRNECTGVNIRVSQEGANSLEGTIIEPGAVIPWGWEFPGQKKEVVADFCVEGGVHYLSAGQNFKFDTLNHVEKTLMPESVREKLRRIFSLVIMEGNSRVLTFFTPDEGKNMKKNKAMKIIEESQRVGESKEKLCFNMNLDVSLRGIGVSLISNVTNKELKRKERREIAFLFVRDLKFKLLDSNDNTTVQLRVKYLNLDNCSAYDTSCPVLLTPSKPQDLSPDTKNYFLDILVSQKKNTEIQHFETIQFLLAEVSLNADGIFLDTVLELMNTFSDIFKNNDPASANKAIAESIYTDTEEAKKLDDSEYFANKFNWITKPVPKTANSVFIRNFVIHPIFVNLSFHLKKHDIAENIHFLVNLFASVAGSAIVNLDNAPLKIKGFRLDNVFDSQGAILKKILDKIKDEGAKSVLKVVGSLDIVGNPVGLFNSISTGIVDLFEKPIDGFLQGPLEGGIGILKGSGSLVKNTVAGIFNSLGKVTGSLASGMSNLSTDKEYLEEREKDMMKRPNHVGEGIYQGFTSLVKGVGFGVKGVFTDPYEGAEREGAEGFFKGALKGVTGLVTKPVAGVLDAASKTAEGIKNTAEIFDQSPNHNRLRIPRAFYGPEKYYKAYSVTDSEILWLLHHTKHIKNEKFRDMSLTNAFYVFPDDADKENSFILALAYEYVLCWSVKKAEPAWVIKPNNINKVNLFQNGLQIDLNEPEEQTKEKNVSLLNFDSAQNQFIGQKIVQLKKDVEKTRIY